MTVYVLLLLGVREHGAADDIEGVYSTKESAEKAQKKYKGLRLSTCIEEYVLQQ